MSATGECVYVPVTRCPLCDFEFSPVPFTMVEIERPGYFESIRLWVSWCSEHDCVICPACYGCQWVTPTPERCALALRHRRAWGEV